MEIKFDPKITELLEFFKLNNIDVYSFEDGVLEDGEDMPAPARGCLSIAKAGVDGISSTRPSDDIYVKALIP